MYLLLTNEVRLKGTFKLTECIKLNKDQCLPLNSRLMFRNRVYKHDKRRKSSLFVQLKGISHFWTVIHNPWSLDLRTGPAGRTQYKLYKYDPGIVPLVYGWMLDRIN